MERMNKFINFLKSPKIWFVIIISIFSIAIISLSIILAVLQFSYFWVYIIYGLSAIVLVYLVYIIIYFAPKIKKKCLNLLVKNKYTKRYIENFGYKSFVNSVIGFIINIGYATTMAILGIIGGSIWYGALATYYIALSCIKGYIFYTHNKRKYIDNDKTFLIDQIRCYRNSGIYLIGLNFALIGAIVQMVITNQGFQYAGILIYVMATYTFYKLTMSIINIIRARKNKDYTVQSIRNINLASTLVTLLSLQTAMFHAFGDGINPALFNALTGGFVSVIIITMALIMFISSNNKLKELKNKDN